MKRTGAIPGPPSQAEFDRLMLQAIHDLRAPVRQSLLRAQLLQRSVEGMLSPASESHLAAVVEANLHTNRLLARLAEFCQVGSGRGLLPPADAAVLFRGAVRALSSDLGLKIEIGEMPSDPVPACLQKVFFELLDNAAKFRKRERGESEIRITSRFEGSRTIFELRDNGIGFDSRYADLLWEPFQKLHAASEYPGSGLGLAIVRRIIESLDGKTWAISIPGEGSTFCFAVPSQS